MNKTPAEQAKSEGLKSLTQISKMTGQSLQTLTNWAKNKPELFRIVLLGCRAKIEGGHEVGFITNAELDSGSPDYYWDDKGGLHRKYIHKTITLTMLDGTKKVFRFADPSK